jgi:hypothetical protein
MKRGREKRGKLREKGRKGKEKGKKGKGKEEWEVKGLNKCKIGKN